MDLLARVGGSRQKERAFVFHDLYMGSSRRYGPHPPIPPQRTRLEMDLLTSNDPIKQKPLTGVPIYFSVLISDVVKLTTKNSHKWEVLLFSKQKRW